MDWIIKLSMWMYEGKTDVSCTIICHNDLYLYAPEIEGRGAFVFGLSVYLSKTLTFAITSKL